jgi:anaerobic ribonucleoside-triphosphate reductase activating protein
MRLSGIITDSLVDGPGVRYVLFTQGCPHKCANCHNPETWPFDGGREESVVKVRRYIERTKKKYQGITFSGGEPFLQAHELVILARAAKGRGWDVVTFTGYQYDELAASPDADVQTLLELTDILIDGPYMHGLKDVSLPFRGSSNQRIIDLNMTRKTGGVWLCAE